MATSTPSKRTGGQEEKYCRLIEDAAKRGAKLALGKVAADSVGWQRVLEHGDELKTAIAEVVVAKTRELSVSNQYADEEVESSYDYLSGHRKPKLIAEQVKCLRELPELKDATFDEKIAARPLPEGAEGWFAIPRWQKIAKTYGEAVQKVLAAIGSKRKFYNYREGQLGPEYLCKHERSARMFEQIGKSQNGNIFVVPAQFGFCHRGKSVRRAREVFVPNEFGLGAFSVGIMLLTHPERLAHYNNLWVDCAGDEFAPNADGKFSFAPYFSFGVGGVGFGTHWVGLAYAYDGSSSAFLP